MTVRDFALAADGDLVHDLLLLQRAAYACEAALIGDERIPALHEGVEDLVSAERAPSRHRLVVGP